MDNLFSAWREFRRGKRKKLDIQEFEFNLENNLFELRDDLENKIYCHSHYTAFNISDPKPRRIHKACVRDRVLHHAIFRILYQIFDKTFIFDAYSCRLNKGTHRAIRRLARFARRLSHNNHRNIYILKCDIKRFFDSIDQNILLRLLENKIKDENAICLIKSIIKSFEKITGKGLPLGNVTSQLFANIYLNEFDQFIKHKLKVKYYLRYCDDFIILSEGESYLQNLIPAINQFLQTNLQLQLHPEKIIIKKWHQGVDFLGYVSFPYYSLLRTKTKRRIFKKIRMRYEKLKNELISKKSFNQTLQSYHGVLKHCRGYKVIIKIINLLTI